MDRHVERLVFVCFDKDHLSSDDLLGVLHLPISEEKLDVRSFEGGSLLACSCVQPLASNAPCICPYLQGKAKWFDLSEGLGQIKLSAKFTSSSKVHLFEKETAFHYGAARGTARFPLANNDLLLVHS
jgi:hypothetical protein